MRMKLPVYIALLLVFTSTFQNTFTREPSDTSFKKVYIVKHGWHTGIIFDRKDALPYLTKLNSIYTEAKYLEISWGDKDFFIAEKETIGLALKAALVPTKSVLLVQTYNKNPYQYFSPENIQELNVIANSYADVMKYLNNSFAIDAEAQQPIEVLRYSSTSCFFLSNEKYHAFKTCNVWIARALKKADKKIRATCAITSGSLMRKARRSAKRLNAACNYKEEKDV